jgi:hypothetical protein
MVADEPTWK